MDNDDEEDEEEEEEIPLDLEEVEAVSKKARQDEEIHSEASSESRKRSDIDFDAVTDVKRRKTEKVCKIYILKRLYVIYIFSIQIIILLVTRLRFGSTTTATIRQLLLCI